MTDRSESNPAAGAGSAFWQWFVRHEAELRTSAADHVPDRIEAELRRIDPRLGVELSDPGEQREMILTAWSRRDAFGAVRDLVAAAPAASLPNWQIIALKPPRGFRFSVDFGGLRIDAAGMRFDPLASPQAPEALGLRIYVSGAPPADERWSRALPLVIETGLGEEAAAEIAHIEPAPAPPPDEKALPLEQLAAYVKWHRKTMIGDR